MLFRSHNAYYSPLTITDSTISGNSADYGDGGGIFNYESSTIDITGTTISNNTAKYGGGISNIDSPLTITTSNISNNTAQYVGGGIANGDSNLTITDSTISYNSTDGDGGLGGGIYNTSIGAETATITRSTIHHNSSHSRGGGIYNQNGTFSVSNSTISYNSTTDPAGLGGGIHNIADFSLSHSTLSGNTAFKGSGLYNRSYDGSICKIYIDHTIVTDQVGGTTGITSQGYNLFAQASVTGADTNAGDLLGSNANLLPLASNGGPTLTHALGSGSAAWNAGNPGATAGAGGVPVTDQRGAG